MRSTCYISMVEHNFLRAFSLENEDGALTATAIRNIDELVMGFYVKCSYPNAWDKIDDAPLNLIKD